jgi:hypothetical protein
MVPAPKLSFITNNNNPTSIGLASCSTIHFDSLKFIVDRLSRLYLSPQEWDSSAIFVGMVHSGSAILRPTLEESSDEDGTTSCAGGTRDPLKTEGAMW